MGDIIGGIIGGVGSLFGGSKAAKQDLTGYNYLTKGAGAGAESGYINNGAGANNALANLLGLNGAAGGAQSSPAFQNYLNSTGYQFQLGEGSHAITGNNASKGLLNSGATAKALTNYGQNLASTSFNNYLNQLGGVSAAGQTGLGQVSQAGTQGGVAAGSNTQSGMSSGFGQLGSAVGSIFDHI